MSLKRTIEGSVFVVPYSLARLLANTYLESAAIIGNMNNLTVSAAISGSIASIGSTFRYLRPFNRFVDLLSLLNLDAEPFCPTVYFVISRLIKT